MNDPFETAFAPPRATRATRPLPPLLPLPQEAADVASRLDCQPRNPDGTYCEHEDNSAFMMLFQASVKAVRGSFKHLSEDDIAMPPHQWFDAALARQIALHVLVTRFDVPKNRIVAELNRSKLAVKRAMEAVEARLRNQAFSETYETIVEETKTQIAGGQRHD